MKTPLVIASILMVLFISTFSFAKDVSFTQEDRDRLIRLEVKVEESSKALNQRIDSLQQLIYILIGVVVAQTIGVIGFVLWDRRTALQPALRKNKELEERQDKVEKALKEIAKVDSKVAEALKNVGLL
ncbi:hypothetical protein TdN_13520 [Thermodesulfovibrio sp. TK110]